MAPHLIKVWNLTLPMKIRLGFSTTHILLTISPKSVALPAQSLQRLVYLNSVGPISVLFQDRRVLGQAARKASSSYFAALHE